MFYALALSSGGKLAMKRPTPRTVYASASRLHPRHCVGIALDAQAMTLGRAQIDAPPQHAEDDLGIAADDGVGVVGSAGVNADGAVDSLDDHRCITGTELESHRRLIGRA